ncbi:MAG: hypothetical protein ACKV2T_43410 [Kofleriaceae bacterium]
MTFLAALLVTAGLGLSVPSVLAHDCFEDCIFYGGSCTEACHPIGPQRNQKKTGLNYDICHDYFELEWETGFTCVDGEDWFCYVTTCNNALGNCTTNCTNVTESRPQCSGVTDC